MLVGDFVLCNVLPYQVNDVRSSLVLFGVKGGVRLLKKRLVLIEDLLALGRADVNDKPPVTSERFRSK